MMIEEEVIKWLKNNNVTPTTDRITSLIALLTKIENSAYNDGIHIRR